MAKPEQTIHFEKSLADLEQLVSNMESGELSLEQSLSSFEQGVKLTRECQQALTLAEQKVEVLLKTESGFETTPFDANE